MKSSEYQLLQMHLFILNNDITEPLLIAGYINSCFDNKDEIWQSIYAAEIFYNLAKKDYQLANEVLKACKDYTDDICEGMFYLSEWFRFAGDDDSILDAVESPIQSAFDAGNFQQLGVLFQSIELIDNYPKCYHNLEDCI